MKSSRLAYLFYKLKVPGFSDHLPIMVLAMAVGVLAGFGAVLFRWIIKVMQSIFYPQSVEGGITENLDWAWNMIGHEAPGIMEFYDKVPWYFIVMMPAIGGLIVGVMIYFGAREAKGHGVPEVMESVALRGGVIKTRVGFIKTIASAITIGSGGSAGQEGPIVQIGASIGSTIGQWFRVSQVQQRTLVGCGAAAGIAATFNAPIAGVIFAMEVILGDFGVASFSPIVVSSVLATAISRMVFGDSPAFSVPVYEMVSYWELGIYPVLGIICGLLAVGFVVVLYKSEDFFEQQVKLPEYIKPMLGAALTGLLILEWPQVFAVGYESLTEVFHNQMHVEMILALIAVKILATTLTIGSGGSGGVFAPSLFIGAMIGGAFGYMVNYMFPGITASPGAYALVATGAMVAGTTFAPITAILIIFELSGDYKIILPLMTACIISVIVASTIKKGSVYTTKLLRRGIDIADGVEQNIMRGFKVKNFMSKTMNTIMFDAPIGEVIKAFETKQASYLYLVDNDSHLVGYISYRDVRRILDEENVVPLLLAEDIAIDNELVSVSPSENIHDARTKMNQLGVTELPVVSDSDNRILLGKLKDTHVLDAYDKAVLRMEIKST
ncbi:MAG: chloride channel protein [Gammaproteobacteria bacterium]|nr:MAG: chloride channel protein [Gammaproteobacteria bacterium]